MLSSNIQGLITFFCLSITVRRFRLKFQPKNQCAYKVGLTASALDLLLYSLPWFVGKGICVCLISRGTSFWPNHAFPKLIYSIKRNDSIRKKNITVIYWPNQLHRKVNARNMSIGETWKGNCIYDLSITETRLSVIYKCSVWYNQQTQSFS